MKAVVLCMLGFVGAISAASVKGSLFTDRYDDVDLDPILDNRRLLTGYINCALDKGKCTNEGRELKSHIKEALETECERCTEKQRKGTRRVIGHLINKEQAFWKELTDKYDPKGQYITKYEKELKDAAKA